MQCDQSSLQCSQIRYSTTRVQTANHSGLEGGSPHTPSPLNSDSTPQSHSNTTSSTGNRSERCIINLEALPQSDDDNTALTSTPMPHKTPSTEPRYAVSVDKISNRKTLDQFASLYSKMIIGIYTCTCIYAYNHRAFIIILVVLCITVCNVAHLLYTVYLQ